MTQPNDILGKLKYYAEKEHNKLLKTYPELKTGQGSPLPYRILAALLSAPLTVIKKAVSLLVKAERWEEDLDEEVKEKERQSTHEGLAITMFILLTLVALVMASVGG